MISENKHKIIPVQNTSKGNEPEQTMEQPPPRPKKRSCTLSPSPVHDEWRDRSHRFPPRPYQPNFTKFTIFANSTNSTLLSGQSIDSSTTTAHTCLGSWLAMLLTGVTRVTRRKISDEMDSWSVLGADEAYVIRTTKSRNQNTHVLQKIYTYKNKNKKHVRTRVPCVVFRSLSRLVGSYQKGQCSTHDRGLLRRTIRSR